MNTKVLRTSHRLSEWHYRVRFLISLCGALMFFVILFSWNFGIETESSDSIFQFEESSALVTIDEIEITRQRSGQPPPPKPIIPNFQPSEQILEEIVQLPEIDIQDSKLIGLGTIGSLPEGDGDKVVANPLRPASVIKIVEPVFPKDAQDAKIEVVIAVTFLVDENGIVKEVFVNEIKQFFADGQFEFKQKIGFGLVEITLQAASNWKFRPAKHGGKNVKSYVKHEFTFGR